MLGQSKEYIKVKITENTQNKDFILIVCTHLTVIKASGQNLGWKVFEIIFIDYPRDWFLGF